jgi:hypothetical protein
VKRLRNAQYRFATWGVVGCVLSLTGITLMSGGQSAAALSGSAATIKVVDVSGIALSGVSCNSNTFCVAVGSESNEAAVLPISHGVPEAAVIVAGAGSESLLLAVNCPSSGYCLAAGQAPFTNHENDTNGTAGILVPINSGAPGEASYVAGQGPPDQPDFVYLYGVGCTSASDCMAAGRDFYDGGIIVPVIAGNPGSEQSWNPDRMNGASCFAKNYCIATGVTEPESGDGNLGFWLAKKIGSPTVVQDWSPSGTGALNGAACHSDSYDSCVAVGSNTAGKKAVVVPIVNNASPRTESVHGVTGLNGVACEGPSYCVAVGQNSTGEGVLVGLSGNKPGATVPVPGTTQLVAVGCASNMSCIAVGADADTAVLVEFSLPLR